MSCSLMTEHIHSCYEKLEVISNVLILLHIILLDLCDPNHPDPCQRQHHTVHRDTQGVFSVGSVTDRNNVKCWRRS